MPLITDAKARSIGPGGQAVAHGGVTGLALLPTATQKGHGKRVLRFVSRETGKRRTAGLGSYPDVGIAAAGRAAREMRDQITAGQDPLEAKAAYHSKPQLRTLAEATIRARARLCG